MTLGEAGCASNADCPAQAGMNKCFVSTKKCGECGVNSDCSGDKPFCVDGKCSATAPAGYTCVTDSDCPVAGSTKCFATCVPRGARP